ncbi:hypothetical protein WG66_003967 [Moniliophthora roreri]|nr:hypothetical protein WG66_003967 [Moniliophthora roreri]
MFHHSYPTYPSIGAGVQHCSRVFHVARTPRFSWRTVGVLHQFDDDLEHHHWYGRNRID